MAPKTKVERLLAATSKAVDVDSSEFDGWGEPSTIFIEDFTFGSTGSTNSAMHILPYDGYAYAVGALCGVGAQDTGPQTLNTLIERQLCMKCLRQLEKEAKNGV